VRDVGLADQVHALLFVADAPVDASSLAEALDVPVAQLEATLEELQRQFAQMGPVQLVQLAGGYQLSTKPDYAEQIARFLKPQRSRLSKSLMEVLAVVAYRQPITAAEIDEVRGVQSDYGIRALVERRLIEEVGRKQTPGRPVLYGTTGQFLHQFKMNDLSELPPLSTGLGSLPFEELL
jgi:segregation and condensation protein B